MDWPPAAGPRADGQVPMAQQRRGPLLSAQRWIQEGWLRDFSKKLVRSQRMGTSVPWAVSWTRLRPQSGAGVSGRQPCVEQALSCWPAGGAAPGQPAGERQPLACAPGEREPGQAGEGGQGPRLGTRGSSGSCLFKGLGEGLGSQLLAPAPRPRALPPSLPEEVLIPLSHCSSRLLGNSGDLAVNAPTHCDFKLKFHVLES